MQWLGLFWPFVKRVYHQIGVCDWVVFSARRRSNYQECIETNILKLRQLKHFPMSSLTEPLTEQLSSVFGGAISSNNLSVDHMF